MKLHWLFYVMETKVTTFSCTCELSVLSKNYCPTLNPLPYEYIRFYYLNLSLSVFSFALGNNSYHWVMQNTFMKLHKWVYFHSYWDDVSQTTLTVQFHDICLSLLEISAWNVTLQPEGIYSWKFTDIFILLRPCVANRNGYSNCLWWRVVCLWYKLVRITHQPYRIFYFWNLIVGLFLNVLHSKITFANTSVAVIIDFNHSYHCSSVMP